MLAANGSANVAAPSSACLSRTRSKRKYGPDVEIVIFLTSENLKKNVTNVGVENRRENQKNVKIAALPCKREFLER